MGICSELKQISIETLDVLKQDPQLVELFLAANYLPESALWKQRNYWNGVSAEQTKENSQNKFRRFRWSDKSEEETLKNQFLLEWEIPELDLDKSWMELTFFLAGYIPGDISSFAAPELESSKISSPKISTKQGWLGKIFAPKQPHRNKVFLDFIAIESSEWDGLPLVNAVGAGVAIGYEMSYESMRYLMPNEVELITNSLTQLSEKGFEDRLVRESRKEIPCSYIDWSDTEGLMEGMIEFYNETLSYYQDAAINKRAMLLYLT
jgi:Domain of unknown function (DUF1877)